MPRYTVENNQGKRVTFEWAAPNPPTDTDLEEVFSAASTMPPPPKQSALRPLAQAATKNLAGKVDPPNPGGVPGTVKRVWDATKETFIPMSADAQKRLFNPVAGRFGLGKFFEEEGGRVAEAVRPAGQKVAEMIAESPIANVSPVLAAGLATPVAVATDILADSFKPSVLQQQIGADFAMHLAKPLTAGVRNKGADKLDEGAVDAGRRGLGFLKSQLNKLRRNGGVERANAVSAEMIKHKVVTPLATADEMLARANALNEKMGNQIGTVINKLESAKVPTRIDPLSLSQKVEDQLLKVAGKGATPAQKAAIKEVIDRILGTADEASGTLGFFDTQNLKGILQQNGHFSAASDAFKADAYRRASGIVNAELRKAIGAAGREIGGAEGTKLLNDYLSANLSKGKAQDAISALTDLANKQAGNKFFDQFTTAGAVGGGIASVAAGKPVTGAVLTTAAIFGKKLADNYGAQLTATGLSNLARLMRVGNVPEYVMGSPGSAKAFVSLLNRMPASVGTGVLRDKIKSQD